jgi:hypothetical protein
MDEALVQQIVDELLSSLEPLDAQSAALLQFLKAKGLATDEEFAPFLDQAENTANVRWRAVKVRIAALISNAMKSAEQPAESTATNNPPIAAKPIAQAKQEERKNTEQPDEERAYEQRRKEQKTEEQRTKDKKQSQEGEKKNTQIERTDTALPPEQRANETPRSNQPLPESGEAPKENRLTNSDAPEAPSKNDAQEAA